jgi:hypothetical protein
LNCSGRAVTAIVSLPRRPAGSTLIWPRLMSSLRRSDPFVHRLSITTHLSSLNASLLVLRGRSPRRASVARAARPWRVAHRRVQPAAALSEGHRFGPNLAMVLYMVEHLVHAVQVGGHPTVRGQLADWSRSPAAAVRARLAPASSVRSAEGAPEDSPLTPAPAVTKPSEPYISPACFASLTSCPKTMRP